MSMKKFLLFAAAAIVAVSADAQLTRKMKTGKLHSKQQMEQKATFKKHFEIAEAKKGVKPVLDKTTKKFSGVVKASDIKPASTFKSFRAGTVQEKYEGSGKLRSTSENTEWEMLSGTATIEGGSEISVLKDVIPNIFGFEEGVIVEYTQQDNNIVIAPQLVASFPHEDAPTGTYYLFLEDANSSNGAITLKMDDTGAITGSYNIIYSVYPASTYNFNDWVATYDGIAGAQYNIPGVIKAPVVSYEPGNLVLFAGLGLNGYSYNNNLSMTGAYATTDFINRTSDKATAWSWSALDAASETGETYATGTDRDFSVAFEDNAVYNVQLIGTNETEASAPYIFGAGRSLEDDGVTTSYENCIIYGGYYNNGFMLNNETPAIMTRFNPDADLAFYGNVAWSTPDHANAPNATKLYLYHEKPSAPLFIQGVTLPMINFSSQENFNLHIKIVKCTYTGSKPELGEVIAEGNATSENINADYSESSGLTAVEIPLFAVDEFGMETELEYIFLDDEFMIIIEGWNNGSFSGILGCDSEEFTDESARPSVWFEMDGEEGSMYKYTSWPTRLFVGLLNASYGYLRTADETNVTLPGEGGQAAIHVEPMLCTSDDNGDPTTSIWLDYDSDDPDELGWITVGIANEVYSDTEFSFDLVFEADALPSGVTSRTAHFVFVQTGAKLEVDVTQTGSGSGGGDGISTVVTKIDNNAPAYNAAGQRVNKNFKGLVVKDGRKFMNK